MAQFYAGIGSRETPPGVYALMVQLASALSGRYVLRSGGADGADSAFEEGACAAGGAREIYLPWKAFNGRASELYGVHKEALDIARSVHPAWDRLGDGPRKLHGRNVYQVLGRSLAEPVSFVVCWTADGCETESQRRSTTGGTATAIVLAHRRSIPVYNLKNLASCQKLQARLQGEGIEIQLTTESTKLTPNQGSLF